MTSSLKKEKEIIVFGGTGSIGSAIVWRLWQCDYSVMAVSRNQTPRRLLKTTFWGEGSPETPAIRYAEADVTKNHDLMQLLDVPPAQDLAGIIYAVGFGPPAGFEQAVSQPLTGTRGLLEEELQRHIIGLHNVMAWFAKYVRAGGFVCVIGSAITRLTDEQCPPWLHAGHYAVAKAAQHEYVKWLRRDPYIRERRIRVHYLAPRAVDTPFHRGGLPEHQPPVKLPISTVVDEVLAAIDSNTAVDKIL